jgi:hypothetical protein
MEVYVYICVHMTHDTTHTNTHTYRHKVRHRSRTLRLGGYTLKRVPGSQTHIHTKGFSLSVDVSTQILTVTRDTGLETVVDELRRYRGVFRVG